MASTSVRSMLTTRGSAPAARAADPQLRRRDAAGQGRGARRCHGPVAHIDVEVDVHAGVAGTAGGDRQRFGHDVIHRTTVQRLAVDDGDPQVPGPRRVLPGVGEVGDPHLDHAAPRQAPLDEAAHRRAVGSPVAQVVMCVQGHQSVDASATSDCHGDRVVPAQRHQRCVGEPRDLGLGGRLPIGTVGVQDVAEIEHGDLGDVHRRRAHPASRSERARCEQQPGCGRTGSARSRCDAPGLRSGSARAVPGDRRSAWRWSWSAKCWLAASWDRQPSPISSPGASPAASPRAPWWAVLAAFSDPRTGTPARHTCAIRSTPGR